MPAPQKHQMPTHLRPSSPQKNSNSDDLLRQIEQNKHLLTKDFDKKYALSLIANILDRLDQEYFRARMVGFDETPERNNPERPLIYIGNHSGMAFPWDAMIFGAIFNRRYDYGVDAIRPIIAPLLTKTTLMNPFQLINIWKRSGAVDATTLNFETLMHMTDQNILIYPEGVPGIGKGFNHKYELQRFATSFVRMSIKYRTDIFPVYTINAEYINPGSYKIEWINKLVQKIGIPFLPISWIIPCIFLQPWIFYFAFPAQLTYVRGKRIKPYEMTDKPFEDLTRDDFERITNQIRAQMQAELDGYVQEYGQKPYRWGELFKAWGKAWKRFPFFLPAAWPIEFHEFDRRYRKYGEVKDMKMNLWTLIPAILKNPFVISFYIPLLGLIPFILRGYFVGGNKK
ncbi:MAG: 1-acyl-sn-glycerol-3-phosphate acyltransferase [Bernardetiaceae bacterium]